MKMLSTLTLQGSCYEQGVTKTPWVQWLIRTPGDPTHSSAQCYDLLQQRTLRKMKRHTGKFQG